MSLKFQGSSPSGEVPCSFKPLEERALQMIPTPTFIKYIAKFCAWQIEFDGVVLIIPWEMS